MERPHEAPEIPLRQLGGIDQRNSPLEVGASNFNFLQGLYPKKNGLLTRLPGKSILQRFDEPVISVHATGDRDNHILVQTRTKLYSFTLDELLGNTEDTITLEDDPSVVDGGINDPKYEDHADIAIINYSVVDGTTAIYMGEDTWTDLPFSHTAINESAVSSVTTGTSGTFTLASGYYWIDLFVSLFATGSALDATSRSVVRLYDNTNSLAVGRSSVMNVGKGNTHLHKLSFQIETTASTIFKVQAQADAGTTLYVPTNAGMSVLNTSVIVKVLKYN